MATMDADRLPVSNYNTQYENEVAPAHKSELPTEKQDYDDIKEKQDSQDYNQTTLDVGPVMEESWIPGDPLEVDPTLPEEHAQFTVRAVFVGCCVGAVVQASNLYLGLKTGFTFGPQLLGGIGGFLVLKPLSRILPKTGPKWLGVGYFGPKENVTVQSAATAAGGLGILFVSGFPAMYQIGLFSAKPQDDIGQLIGFVMSVAFYGMTFAVPLRAFFILRQRLTFPTPSATAYAIRSLHATGSGRADAKVKGRWLLWSFVICFLQKTASTYLPGILYDWHFFNWIAVWGAPKAQYIDNWGWYFEITPAFFGAGILSGTNASLSFYAGSIMAWAIIGPALVATGRAVGRDVSEPGGLPYRSYYSMSPRDPTSVNASPRYNLLWIGVLIMLVSAFVELAVEWRTIAGGFQPMILAVRNKLRARKGLEPLVPKERPVLDPAPKKDQVPVWVYGPLTLVAIAITLIVQGVAFGVNVGLSVLALILAFIFSFIGVLSAGVTDINPVSTCAKASQLIMAGPTHGKYLDSVDPVTGYNMHALRVNLLSGMVAAGAAAQASDLTGDLKTGHLLRAKPVAQYFAQLIGAFVSVFLSTAFFILFTSASPCILELEPATPCQYSVPSAAAWWAVSVAVTGTSALPVPTTAGILAIVFAVAAAGIIVFRAWFCPAHLKGYVVNPSAFGLAFVLPQTQYGAAMATAALLSIWWRKRWPSKYEQVAFSFAAGMITGEGLGGVMQAILTIAGAGPEKGSMVGCPDGAC